MRRKLAILGLAVPLVAFIVVLIFLYLFGTSEPTFETATRELARDHTVVLIREEPPAALIVPDEPPDSVILIVVLPDDERHVWSAIRALGLLDHVDPKSLGLIPATLPITPASLLELVELTRTFVPVDRVYLAGFAGGALTSLCAGDGPGDEWSGVAVVGPGESASFSECGGLSVLRIEEGANPGGRMVRWMLEQE